MASALAMPSEPTFIETEIGPIPADWVIKRLGDVCEIFGRIGFRGYTINDIVREGEGPISLSPSNITNGELNLSRCTHLSWAKWKESPEIQVESGDTLLVKTGSTVGKTAYVKSIHSEATVNPQVVVLKKRKIDDRFLGYTMASKVIQNQLVSTTVGGALPTLSQKQVANYIFACPKERQEQISIAEALSDTDALIEAVECLITKRRRIKQSAVQDLLSGQRRLPGFSGEWGSQPFADIFDFWPTATNSRADLNDDGDTHYVHYGDIHTQFHSHLNFRDKRLPRIARQKCPNAALLRNGDWIMADASEDYEGVCKSVEVLGLSEIDRAVSGLHTFLLREKSPTFSPGFKGHLGNLNSLREQYQRVMTGMKVFGVSKAALRQLVLPIPEPKEQVAIVQVLSEMDAEIYALEEKLAKIQHIKRGMMQDLLTGRARLA